MRTRQLLSGSVLEFHDLEIKLSCVELVACSLIPKLPPHRKIKEGRKKGGRGGGGEPGNKTIKLKSFHHNNIMLPFSMFGTTSRIVIFGTKIICTM